MIINDASRVMFKTVASFTIIIYDRNMLIVKTTGVSMLSVTKLIVVDSVCSMIIGLLK
jgi:hypothetical protein